MVTMESRYDAFLRNLEGQLPSPASFDTAISNTWAYNLAFRYVDPGSCPIKLPAPVLPALSANTSSPNASVQFYWTPSQSILAEEDSYYVAWVNQLAKPIYTNLTITSDGLGTAPVPASIQKGGTTFAALVGQKPDNIDDLGLATLAGPMLLNMV